MPDASGGFTIVDIEPEQDGRRGPPQRDKIIAAVINAGVTFWSDPDGYAYATVPIDDRIERHRVQSRKFRLAVRHIYGAAHPSKNQGLADTLLPGTVSDNAMAEALPQFEAMALQERIDVEPEVRVIHRDGGIWLDLGDAEWRAVRIDAAGWRVVDKTHVPLIRPNGMRALPLPGDSTGALTKLRRLVNVETDRDFILVVSWLVAALYPTGPYCVLAIDGEQGSGKSTAAQMLRQLIDPNAAPLRAMPKTEQDMIIAARNGRVIALDNVSYIEPEMADAICRVATGAGFGTRTLYETMGETIAYVCRPVLLNGIPSLLGRGDLADRALAITLPTIPHGARRPESEIWAAFEAAAPDVLGLLLNGLATAMRNLPTLRLSRLPRMADFCRLACAAAPAFGWTAETVLEAIENNRSEAVAAVLDADPMAGALCDLVAGGQAWSGTATELLGEVNRLAPLEVQRERSWPKDGARLSARIKRAAPALRAAGVDVIATREAHTGRRLVTVTPQGSDESASPASPSVTSQDLGRFSGDAGAFRSVTAASPSGAGDARVTLGDAGAIRSVTRNHERYQELNSQGDAGDAGDAVLPPLGGSDEWEATL